MREICFGTVPHAWSIPLRGVIECVWCRQRRWEDDEDFRQQEIETLDSIRREHEAAQRGEGE